MKQKTQRSVSIQNKRATFDYELLDTYTAGLVLVGTEIKSLRLGKASLVDAYCFFHNGELWLKNANISEYFYASSSLVVRSFVSFRTTFRPPV